MKYVPKKVFIMIENGYEELTYEEYCSLCEQNPEYQDKRFLPSPHARSNQLTDISLRMTGQNRQISADG